MARRQLCVRGHCNSQFSFGMFRFFFFFWAPVLKLDADSGGPGGSASLSVAYNFRRGEVLAFEYGFVPFCFHHGEVNFPASFLFVSAGASNFSYPWLDVEGPQVLDVFTNDVLTLGYHEWRGSSTAGPLHFASRSSCSTLVHFFVVDFVSLIWTSASFCFSL